jgi:DNA polymerase III delta prime subunit
VLVPIGDLAPAKKKIEELKTWIRNKIDNREKNRCLMLTGPPGSGKLTSVLSVCSHLNVSVIEWRNNSAADDDFDFGIEMDYKVIQDPSGE